MISNNRVYLIAEIGSAHLGKMNLAFKAIKEAKKLSKDTVVIINSCGDAYKDRAILEKKLGKKYVKSN